MAELENIIKNSVSSFPNISVEYVNQHMDFYGILVENYTEFQDFIEMVRKKYDKEVLLEFEENDEDIQIQVRSIEYLPNTMGYKRLIRAILDRKQKNEEFEYWIEDGRLFLRGDFEDGNREISFHGMTLCTIKMADNGEQIRVYVLTNVNHFSLRDLRHDQILKELTCPDCGSEGAYVGYDQFYCKDCDERIDLLDLDLSLTMSLDRIVSYIKDNYTYISYDDELSFYSV